MCSDHSTPKVLVIDDDPAICEMLKLVLEDEGFDAQIAFNGIDGLNQLRSDNQPCLILLDLNMPVMTGWEFRHEQKQDPQLATIPVAIISADRSITQQPFSIDALDYFRKPIDFDRLLKLVADVCEQ